MRALLLGGAGEFGDSWRVSDVRLTALACSQAPEGYHRWTVRLLADLLGELAIVESISTMTVQRSQKNKRHPHLSKQ